MPSIEKIESRLEEGTAHGDFSGVVEVGKLQGDVLKGLRNPLLRARRATTLAESYFYLGADEKAKHLLSSYVSSDEQDPATAAFLGLDLSTRQKLQLVDYFLSQRDWPRAEKIAKRIQRRIRSGDAIAIAECCYFLARCYARMNQYQELDNLRDLAISSLGAAFDESAEPSTVRKINWLMGCVFLATGFGQYRAGHSARAKSAMYSAKHLFHLGNIRDRRRLADIRHVLGSILRSEDKFDLAITELNSAKKTYEQLEHNIFISRVQVDIARTYIHRGDWSLAEDSLKDAEDTCRKAEESDPARRDRQLAEVLLWKANLSIDKSASSPSKDITQIKDADNNHENNLLMAKKLAREVKSSWLLTEINICMGQLKINQNQQEEGKRFLEEARDIATTNNFAQLRVNAYLSLAEYHAKFAKNVGEAVLYHLRAKEIMTPYTSQYIKKKEVRIDAMIKGFQGDYFLLTSQDIGSGNRKIGLKEAGRKCKTWCVHNMLKQKENLGKDRLNETAKELGVKVTALNRYVAPRRKQQTPNSV